MPVLELVNGTRIEYPSDMPPKKLKGMIKDQLKAIKKDMKDLSVTDYWNKYGTKIAEFRGDKDADL